MKILQHFPTTVPQANHCLHFLVYFFLIHIKEDLYSQSLATLFSKPYFFEGQLICRVLISAIQQSDLIIHVYTFFFISLLFWFITGY